MQPATKVRHLIKINVFDMKPYCLLIANTPLEEIKTTTMAAPIASPDTLDDVTSPGEARLPKSCDNVHQSPILGIVQPYQLEYGHDKHHTEPHYRFRVDSSEES